MLTLSNAMRAALLAGSFIAPLIGAAAPAQAQCKEAVPMRFDIGSKIVRSQIGFTQGLEFRDGQLYESTGRIGGTTQINTISLAGQVKTLADRGTAVFGEGLTILNDEVIQLTWQEHKVFVYDLAGHEKRQMRNPREGWGLTNDGRRLIFSDGGESIYFTDPRTFGIGQIVRLKSAQPGPVLGLNELEWVKGKIYGNIFTTRAIVRLDPTSGCIEAVGDLGPLWNAMTPEERGYTSDGDNVLNGIAYDEATGLFYLTGKRWKVIFTGRFQDTTRGPRAP